MATTTTNYNLKKPDTTDAVKISDINGNMDTIDTTLANKLDKLTYEWNKQVAFGSTGKLLLYKGRCYDTNITIDIDTTTATTYHATFVVATQNSKIMKMTVYGDPSNTVGNSLYVVPCTGQTSAETETIEIYMSPQPWSKNLIRIRAVAPRTAPTNVCENISSIPSTATSTYASGAIVNALDSKMNVGGTIGITENRYTYTTTTAEIVSFTVPAYTTGCTLDVYINGMMCIPNEDYTLSGNVVTLTKELEVNQKVHFVVRKVSS